VTAVLPSGPIVDVAWLAAHLSEVAVADVRWYLPGPDRRSGRAAYAAGHLPGAVHVDLDADLAGPASPAAGRHPLPDPEDFAAAMSPLGIGDGTPVVAYDDAGGAIAARLVWMLRVLGRPAALLDGGLAAWSGALETGAGEVDRRPAVFTAQPWPAERLATIGEVARVADPGSGLVLLDARAPERYRGESEPVDPRPGHIPGARNLPFSGNLDTERSGRFRKPDELRRLYETAGAGTGADVVASCGSGVTACHDLLALEVAGLGPGRLFVGSWSQWSSDPARPATTGSRP
jgi:thiosulfate/3-mercaptopyruvate sulfurtransferase